MRFLIMNIILFFIASCGFKATPTPIYPTSMQKEINDEISRRNQEPTEIPLKDKKKDQQK